MNHALPRIPRLIFLRPLLWVVAIVALGLPSVSRSEAAATVRPLYALCGAYPPEMAALKKEFGVGGDGWVRSSIKGIELAVEQPLGKNFGVSANYTYADAKEKGGGDLVGASRNTYNVVGYYEDDRFNARLAYNFRSHFYSGLDRSTAFNQADTGNLAASIGFKINEHLSLSLDGHNLNNPKLRYYALNEDQPRSIYQNGRQYYLTLRAKL